MKFAKALTVTMLSVLLALAASDNTSFDLKVQRVRMLRNQSGNLHIDAEGVTFRSSDGKTTVTISMKDLREADVADPHALRFKTYEVQKWEPAKRHEHTFHAQPHAPAKEMSQFLTSRIH